MLFLAPFHQGKVRHRPDQGPVRECLALDGQGQALHEDVGWGWWRPQDGSGLRALWQGAAGLGARVHWLKSQGHKLVIAEVLESTGKGLGGRLQGGRQVWLRLGQGLQGLVLVWDDLGIYWVVGPAAVMTPRHQKRPRPRSCSGQTPRFREAVEWAGGILHDWRPLGPQEMASMSLLVPCYWVEWSSYGQRATSIIDERLNVIQAGFCLTGTDRLHDLISLVSLHSREF